MRGKQSCVTLSGEPGQEKYNGNGVLLNSIFENVTVQSLRAAKWGSDTCATRIKKINAFCVNLQNAGKYPSYDYVSYELSPCFHPQTMRWYVASLPRSLRTCPDPAARRRLCSTHSGWCTSPEWGGRTQVPKMVSNMLVLPLH